MPKSTDNSGRLGRRTTTHGGREKLDLRTERRCGAADIPSKEVELRFIKDFPGHCRFFLRSCGVRFSDVGALALVFVTPTSPGGEVCRTQNVSCSTARSAGPSTTRKSSPRNQRVVLPSSIRGSEEGVVRRAARTFSPATSSPHNALANGLVSTRSWE